jgi:LuxR family maltose regulon positive regulatory protein
MEPDAAPGPVLETKLFVPRWRPGLVPRTRLVNHLQKGAARKLTLLSAPPGFGKTTLLAEWLAPARPEDRHVAWLSLDETDNQPATFWTYVISALQTVQPTLGQSAIALLQSQPPPAIESLLAMLLNQIAGLGQPLLLVLDDYHVIDAGPIQHGIAFLLDHLPPHLHLVIASRTDPALPLARLRARAELAEIRAADLRFTVEEAAAFLNEAMGLEISARDVAALEARTEGWIAGLQLAALSMHGRDDLSGFITAFTGNDRYVVDYLVEEVLQRQPPGVRSFLLETSILDRLTGSLCDAVTGQDGGKAVLESLERANLFLVPLDDKRQWYRYHHLFADVLREHVRLEMPERMPLLYGRASAWYEQHGHQTEAIRCALAARDFERTAGLVEATASATIQSNHSGRLLDWLAPLPDELIRMRPVLSTYYAFALSGIGDFAAADRWLEVAEDAPPGMVVVDHDGFRSVPAMIALARAFRAQAGGDVAGTVAYARQALDLVPQDNSFVRGGAALCLALAQWMSGDLGPAQRTHADGIASLEIAGDVTLALSAAGDGAILSMARGRLSEARRVFEQSVQRAIDHGGAALLVLANLYVGLSELHCERNELEAATRYLRQCEELVARQGALRDTPYRLCRAQARVRQAAGDLDGALDLLEQAERQFVRGPAPDFRPISALRARVWLVQGRLAEAASWVREQHLSVDDELDYPHEFQHLTLARLLIATSDDRASRLLARLLEAAEHGQRIASVIEILVLQALARGAPAGLVPLQRALGLAEAEGYVRIFVDEGARMRDLLRRAGEAAYARRLLAAFDIPAVSSPGLAEPLTPRELEVLRLVAAGLRNQEIAEQLVISLPTVKRHIANAYGKLGVTHRTEAVARATELHLL